MVSAGAVSTGATLAVLIYSLYVANLLAWKFNAGPVLYFVIFVISFLMLRLTVSPLVSIWANHESAIENPSSVPESTPSQDTCAALFQVSNGDLMDDMTGYSKEKLPSQTCPITPPTNATGPTTQPPYGQMEPGLPPGSSFFHFCSPNDQPKPKPVQQSKLLPRPNPAPTVRPAPTVEAARCSVSSNRYSFYG